MRPFLLTLALAAALAAPAQQAASSPAAGSNWQLVQALPIGTSINIKAQRASANCKLKSVDADSLTCTHGKDMVFPRADVQTIRIPRRGASTAVMAGIGAGVGAATVKIAATSLFNGFFNGKAKGSVYAGGAGLGAIVFGSIGYFAHPIHSTVYKAP